MVGPETLCTLLAEAEKWNDKSTLLQGVKPAGIKRKYRQSTPDEQLTMSDEEKFKEEERRIRRRQRRRTSPMGSPIRRFPTPSLKRGGAGSTRQPALGHTQPDLGTAPLARGLLSNP